MKNLKTEYQRKNIELSQYTVDSEGIKNPYPNIKNRVKGVCVFFHWIGFYS